MRWVTEDSVHDVMAFHYGRFDVSTADAGDGPPLTVYANRDHLGFAPGNRQQTLETLRAALQAYSGYFGPYPFRTLTVTETPAYGGQAFPGLVLLSFEGVRRHELRRGRFFSGARGGPPVVGGVGELGGLPRPVDLRGVRALLCGALRARGARRARRVRRDDGDVAP